tara:strand:+ start:422 stop:637 length:216 start_codon:yes stop_codon:yes gene_type:complete
MSNYVYRFTAHDGETYDLLAKSEREARESCAARGWPECRKMERIERAHKCPGCGAERTYGYEHARCWGCGW